MTEATEYVGNTFTYFEDRMDNSESPVFVVGCIRSGTTLLRQMLNSHPRLAIFHESFVFRTWYLLGKHFRATRLTNDEMMQKFISFFLQTYNPFGHGVRPIFQFLDTPSLRNSLMKCDRSIREILKIFMKGWARSQNKARWGDKATPIHSELRRMYEMFPHSKFIHIIRDPRGVSYSLIQSGWARDCLAAAYLWRDYVSQINRGLAEIPAGNVYEIRYEDLCTGPQPALERLCRFLNEDYDREMLDYFAKWDHVISNINVDEIVRNVDKPLIQDNHVRWQAAFSESQIRCIDQVARFFMKSYGYSIVQSSSPFTMRDDLRSLMNNVIFYRRLRQRRRRKMQRLFLHLSAGLSFLR